MEQGKKFGKSTASVHGGNYNDEKEHGVVTPIFTSTAYDYEDVDLKAYPRYFNTVNQRVLSEKIALLENGEEGMVFSSGLSAIMTAFYTFLNKGDHAVLQRDIYGGSQVALTRECSKFGIELTFINGHRKEDFQKAIKENTKLIFIETPSNPLLKIIDVQKIAELGSDRIVTMIDNTFASPINQNPITLGIDIVMHSATKYLGGHSDILAGALVSSKKLMDKIRETSIHLGGVLDANSCYLLERSIKTLEVRVKRQNLNAQALAEYLQDHKEVTRVYYPGLPSHENHELASRQMKGYGGMLSFETKENAAGFIARLKIIARAMSLGGVESTICLPVKTSHSLLTPEERAEMGISDNLIRISVGIEDARDLMDDLEQALT